MPSMVVIPAAAKTTRRIQVDKVHSIVSNRTDGDDEQFLVQWRTDTQTQTPPLSWHSLHELGRCLEHLQDYLDNRAKQKSALRQFEAPLKKRKSPDSETESERRPSPIDRRLHSGTPTFSVSQSSSVASTRPPSTSPSPSSIAITIYNGILTSQDGFVFAKSGSGPDIPRIDIQNVPTPEMLRTARKSKVINAEILIRAEYTRRLEKVPGKRIHLTNIFDRSTPSLWFRYIPDYVLREGVFKVDPAAQVGCKQCSPHMGRDIGCEYTKKCDCLEYAAVDEARLDEDQKILYNIIKETGGSTIGLPKKFPYYAEGTKIQRAGCLVPFYLRSRHPIYECNDNCNCGLHCRNKNVQFGRTVELEIFKTSSGRGWGLRCKEFLHEGQFIDTYRGEIITDAEATRREESSSKTKASYLYSLDKFADSEGLAQEDIYVVDGEFMGGPTKFMNHSCEPNCRQYTVSYNKHDCRVYDIAFFACRDIAAGEELTFDYIDKEEDKDEEKETEQPGEGAIPCLCGASNCRKWLWT